MRGDGTVFYEAVGDTTLHRLDKTTFFYHEVSYKKLGVMLFYFGWDINPLEES